ncbi:Urea carboxylase-related ABC transporter, permease protein [Minicystis rosea]|nr:Urea carboxylase-related ABC transporter, permease protein [Minicystis rosea]
MGNHAPAAARAGIALPGARRPARLGGSLVNAAILALSPTRAISRRTALTFGVLWAMAAIVLWMASPFATLPTPRAVWSALGELWWTGGMGPELWQTLVLIAEATLLTAVLSLALAYASVVRLFVPLLDALSKLRFLSLTALVFPLTLITGGGHALKVAMLTFGMSAFYLTAMVRIVREIPPARFDQMRVLGASDLRIVWEVVILGTLDRALDALRQNVAMGWSMITMVEGISRSEGGIGALLLNQYKHLRLAHVYAILVVVLGVGLLIDWGMGALSGLLCPWTRRREAPESERDQEG